jgi:hypothetical protein
MPTLLLKIWEFLKSPTFGSIASLATVITALYLIFKFLIRPLKVYYDAESLKKLSTERLLLRQIQNSIDQLDRATYWEDLLYTPLEAEIRPFQIIPPEFVVLKTPQPDRLSKKKFGISSELVHENHRRYKDILAIFNKHREPLIILGDPGAGKSVSFRHAVREVVKAQSRWWVAKPLIPIYVQCGHFTEVVNGGPLSVEAFIREHVKRTFSFFEEPSVFNEYLMNGRLVLFFDALDEMPKADYADRINLLSEFASRYSHNRIFFSCRKLDYDNRLNVREVGIRPFDKERRRLFLKKGLSQKFNRKVVKLLTYQLETDSKLSELLSNPFFCQLVIFYVQTLERIPTNRYQLFSVYIERRLAAEQSRWGHSGITPDEVVDCLSRLGYLMSESRGVGTSIRYDDAMSLLNAETSTADRIKRLLNASVQAKLLLQLSEHDLLQFSHHRLQEYFAAHYATKHIPWRLDVVQRFTDDLWWREILIMMMGMEGDQSDKIGMIIESAFADCRNLFDKIIEKCEKAIQGEHSQYGLTGDEDFSLKESYIQSYLRYFDAAEDDQLLIENLLQTERLIDMLEALTERKGVGMTSKLIRRIFPSLASWAPLEVPSPECYQQTMSRLAETLSDERDSIRNIRRLMVSRLALAVTCATNCNLHLGSPLWSRLKQSALSILKRGVPLEQVKMVKEVVTQDNDDDIRKQLRRLLTGDSRWLSREIFNTLLDYRIPHVGFDKRSILFLWREINYYGSTGMFREYLPQLMNSSIRLKSMSILGLLISIYLIVLVFLTGLIPWATYQWTLWESTKFEYTIKPALVVPLCWIPVAIVLVLDLSGAKLVSAIGATYGFSLSFLIFGLTAILNENRGKLSPPPPRSESLFAKIFFSFVAICILGYLLFKIISFAARFLVYVLQAYQFWLFRRRLKEQAWSVEGRLSANQLLEFYEKFQSDQGKAMVIQVLEKYAEHDEALINQLMDLAFRETNKVLADGLWHLVYELEKRESRAA